MFYRLDYCSTLLTISTKKQKLQLDRIIKLQLDLNLINGMLIDFTSNSPVMYSLKILLIDLRINTRLTKLINSLQQYSKMLN